MVRAMVPWEVRTPRLFNQFRNEMDRLFSDFFGEENGGEQTLVFAPRTNIAETEKDYEITVDMPGMKPEDFTVEFRDGELWITGERRREHEEKGKTWHRVERQYGEFRRVLPLGSDVKADQIHAEYKEGVLYVTVPKSEASQPKKIEVKGGSAQSKVK